MNFSKTIGVQQGSFLFQVLLSISFCFLGALTQTAPGNPIITGPTNAVEGQSVSLNCTTTGGSSPVTVRWQRNTVLVDGTIDGSFTNSLGIAVNYNTYSFTVSRTDNLVSYICLVHNAALSSNLTREWTISVYVQASAPVINGPTTTLDSGNTYTYTCTAASGRPAPEIEWKLGSTLSSATTLGTGTYDPLVTNSDSTFTRISTLSWVPIVGDNGKSLFCIASQSATVPSQNTFRVISVQQIPIIRSAQSAYSTQAGQSVVLRCNVTSAFPAITSAYWQKRGNSGFQTVTTDSRITQASFSTNNPDLTINNAQVSDAGEYRCFATNQAGTGSSGIITLSVTGTYPTVQVGNTAYTASTGSSVTLVCNILSSNPAATDVFWEKNVNGVPTNVFNIMSTRISGATLSIPSLTISNVQQSDAGTYFCYARNSVGNGAKVNTTLIIQNPPSITILRSVYQVSFTSDVTLVCIVTSSLQLVTFTWRKYSGSTPVNLVVSGNSHYSGGTRASTNLTVHGATFTDEAYYDCQATNAAGTSTSSQIFLDVVGNVPNVTIPQAFYQVTAGGTVTIQCNVSSNPFQISVEWQRINSGVSTAINVTAEARYSGGNVNMPSLTITNAVSGDAGIYVCSASNNYGKGVSGQTNLTVQGNKPTINIGQQSSYNILIGNPVTLTCIPSGTPTVFNVFWTRTRSGSTTNVVAGNTGYGSVFSNGNVNSPSLTLTNAQQADSGTYTCKAQNAAGTTDSSPIFLTVSGTQPSVSIPQNSYSVITTQNATITCTVSAIPTANSIWWTFIPSSGIQTNITTSTSKYTLTGISGTSSTLFIRNTASSDSGTYRCTATNSVGQGSDSATLSVSGSVPALAFTQSSYNVLYGTNAFLQCSISANPTAQIATWFFVTRQLTIQTSSSKYTVTTNSIYTTTSLTVINTDSSDEGTYICRAGNQVGSGSASANLTITGSLPTVTIPQGSYSSVTGQSATITCSVSAIPTATSITWRFVSLQGSQTSIQASTTKYTLFSSSTSSSLTILNTAATDSGTYTCIATNAVGGASNSTTLSVSGSRPVVNIPANTYSSIVGQNATIPCTVSANPDITSFAWTFTSTSGSQIQISTPTSKYSFSSASSDRTLTVLSTVNSDSGTYTCSATNLVGTSSDQAVLSVTGSIPTVTLQQTNYAITYGQNVTLQCTVTASPAASSATWQKAVGSGYQDLNPQTNSKYSVAALPNPALTIVGATFTDSTQYRCTATNQVGQGVSTTATVQVQGEKPSVSLPQNSYMPVVGTNVTILCSVSVATNDPPVTSVSWKKATLSGTGIITVSQSIKYSGSTVDSPSLIIQNVDSNDNGNYSCLATNARGTSESPFATLQVTGSAPSVNIPQSSYSTVIGTSILIPCSVSATPDVTGFRWTFQPSTGGSVTIAQSGGRYQLSTNWQSPSLRVVNTTFGDTGTYTCQSTNIVGTVSDSTALTITGTVPNVTLSQASYSVLKGQNITLDCWVTGGSPPEITAIKWRYRATVSSSPNTLNVNSNQNKYVGSTVANPNLTIINVVDGDQGLYACIASNLYGDGESDQVLLDVTGSAPTVVVSPPSLSVTQTQNVTITCSVTGADPAIREVRWEKHSSGGQVTQITIGGRFSGATFSNPSLTISFVEPSDTGIYYCTAENLVASTKSTTECSLTVTGSAPSSVSITRGGSVVTTTTVSLGSSITLTCAASGSPAPTFSWRFGGAQVATGSSYTINSVAKNQDGVYTCRATNLLSSADGTVTMDVQYAPEDVRSAAQTDVTGSVGGTVQLSCNVDADPTPSYRWYRNNVLISTVTTRDYSVLINSNDDFGSYSCAAQNSLGTANLAFTISNAGTGNTGASTVSSGLSTGEIAAIVLALLLLLLLIIIIIICCITHGVCGAICGKKDTKGRVEPVEKEVYKETSKEVIIPRFHEESIKGKREPSAVSRKDVDVRVHQNGHFRKENDYEIVRYETVPATSTHVITESPRAPRRLPKLEYTYEDVAEKKRKRRKKRHHKRRHGAEEVVVERVIRSRSASPTRVYRTETEEPVGYGQRSPERAYRGYHDDRIVETVRTSSRSPSRRRRVKEDEEMIIERSRRSPSTRRRHEENFMTQETIGNGDIIHGEGDLRAYNGVVYREAPSRHSSGRYYVEGGSMRRSHSGRRDYGSDDEVEVVYGKEYVVEH